jgi:DNA-binding NtrC family response regulator
MGAPRVAGTARAQRTGTPTRVLVVDDEAVVQRLLWILLERQGYVVAVAGNPSRKSRATLPTSSCST